MGQSPNLTEKRGRLSGAKNQFVMGNRMSMDTEEMMLAHLQAVTQADQRVDFDFLRATHSAGTIAQPGAGTPDAQARSRR